MSQELKKEFLYLQKIDQELDSLTNNQVPISTSAINEFQVEDMFKCFDTLLTRKGSAMTPRKQFSNLESKDFTILKEEQSMMKSKEISKRNIGNSSPIENIREVEEKSDEEVLVGSQSKIKIEEDELKEIQKNMTESGGGLFFSNFQKIYKAEQSNQKIEIPSLGDNSVKRKKEEVSKEIRRILQVHYNLLYALSKHCKKSMNQGVNRIQDDILQHHNRKTFQGLIYLIKRKVDFKKIANLICLINFTNHGFQEEEHEEIIFKVVENYPIKVVYILLKMDSYGFFSKKQEIFGIANSHYKKTKLTIFNKTLPK